MGEVIELAPYLQRRRNAGAGRGADRRRSDGLCESCGGRAAAAEVLRSDAAACGLGARQQCRRCLAAELRQGRCLPDAQHAAWVLARRLRSADGVPRLEIEWDVRAARALSLDGVSLDP